MIHHTYLTYGSAGQRTSDTAMGTQIGWSMDIGHSYGNTHRLVNGHRTHLCEQGSVCHACMPTWTQPCEQGRVCHACMPSEGHGKPSCHEMQGVASRTMQGVASRTMLGMASRIMQGVASRIMQGVASRTMQGVVSWTMWPGPTTHTHAHTHTLTRMLPGVRSGSGPQVRGSSSRGGRGGGGGGAHQCFPRFLIIKGHSGKKPMPCLPAGAAVELYF